ncbi:hypothetical protein [Sphingomonas sp.]|uniref:hypothetical protein n=1 Tax=Sphingomonas sp. TaxID=28214 RepID=UPI000DB86541|nr:hypothetical protein [Sphingomonas sp.]PZU11602.1 MAG: hypothetical protein DI605_01015 [Sphingomonas sp.]
MAAEAANPLLAPQGARAAIRVGDRFVMEAEARATPLGLLAVGGLVAAILLAIPPIVRARRGGGGLSPTPKAPAPPQSGDTRRAKRIR